MDDIDDSDYDDSDEDFLLPEIYSRHPDEVLDPEPKKNEGKKKKCNIFL